MLARVIKSQRSPIWPTLPTNDLPPKHVCDELIDRYLRTIETVYRILHVSTFQKHYEQIWRDVAEPNAAFMVQLKLVLAIGAILYDQNCSLRPEAARWVYEAQTWLSSPVFKSKLGVQYLQLSILLLLARENVDIGGELVWISAGAVLRAAIYIGLHKDPAQLPRMTTLECEMRRRIWSTILEINLHSSLMSGGPCLISMDDFTTQPPRNFDDEQFTTPDPIAKAESVYTQTSISNALRSTYSSRLAVIRFLNDVNSSGTYEETLRIDTELRAAYRTLRRTLEAYPRTIESAPHSFALEAVDFIMHRYISSLHIPFFNVSLHEAVYAFSRKAVVDSSLKIWSLASPASSIQPQRDISSESDLARLCRCGAGFFRASAFHSSSFLAVELRAQLQEEDTVPRPDLLNIIEDAIRWTMGTIEAGETGIKGYMMLHILAAQVDGIKRRVSKEEMPILLVRGAEAAIAECLPLLEKMAGVGQQQGSADEAGPEDLDFQISPDFMEDWDTMMADVFNFGEPGAYDSLLT
jgi:hypothetical protein